MTDVDPSTPAPNSDSAEKFLSLEDIAIMLGKFILSEGGAMAIVDPRFRTTR